MQIFSKIRFREKRLVSWYFCTIFELAMCHFLVCFTIFAVNITLLMDIMWSNLDLSLLVVNCKVPLLTECTNSRCCSRIWQVLLWSVGVCFASFAALPGTVGRRWCCGRGSGRLLSSDQTLLWSYTPPACSAQYNCYHWQPTRLQPQVCRRAAEFTACYSCEHVMQWISGTMEVVIGNRFGVLISAVK